ncbi:MAG TPA: glycosyltransferase family 87 protein [Chthoniobacterales bacterium]|jgi:hypothetical protein
MPERAHNDKLQRALRVLIIGIGAVTVLVQWVSTMLTPHGDFTRHWEFGRRFVHGEFLYSGGLNIPYPPFFAMVYAPLSLLPLQIAKPILFVFGFSSLIAILWILDRLTDRELKIRSEDRLWIIAGTLFICSRFILRDFDDGGQNLILVALAWAAIYLWSQNRDLLAGASLGFAVAIKCTPAIFIAYFAWKRQWKIVGLALIFAAGFTITPAIWQKSSYGIHMREWVQNVVHGVSEADPSVGVLGPEQLQNKSLRPVLARYLMRLTAGHPGRLESGGYIDFLALSPSAAGLVIKGILLIGMVTAGWLLRAPVTRDDPAIVWECAALSLLMLLYSPITWGQHCVAAIPAIYLILRSFASGRRLPSWAMYLLGAVAAVILIPNRSIIGRNASLLVESYHFVTFSLIALLILVLYEWHHRFKAAGVQSGKE